MQATIPENEKLFTNRALIALIVPLAIEQLLAILLGTVDTVMVSAISESAVSSISLVDSINVLFIQLFSAMGTGGAVVAAQYLGKQEPLHACNVGKQLLYVSLFFSFALMAVSLIFCDQILLLVFGTLPADTMNYCRSYMRLSALSYPALALYNGGAALLRAMSNSKASMFTALVMNIVNIGGNALLIYGFHMEVAGAGLSTLFSRIIGAVVVIRLLLSPTGTIHIINPTRFTPDRDMIKRIFRIGVPNGLENSMFQIGKLLVAGIVAGYGVSVIAANAISNSVVTIINLPCSAIGLAMITVVGQCIGACNIVQAKYYTKTLLRAAYLLMLAMNTFLFFFARPMLSLFSLSPEAVDIAEGVLRFYTIAATLFWPASFTIPNALRAAGDAKFTMIVAVLSMWIFRIGFSYLLAYTFDMQLLGVWIAMAIDWVARGICFTWRYRSGKWLKQGVV